MLRWWKWILLGLMTAALPFVMGAGGCGGSGGGLLSISQSQEIQIGQQAAADLEAKYGVVNNPTETARVQRIGLSIARISPRADLPWTFKVLNMSDINALSLPGGFVYVTQGLMNLNPPDDQLAGVLGHESAHVVERHSVKAIERAMTYQLLEELVLRNSGAAVQQAANMAVQLAVELPHSRADETQADEVGMKLAYNAGYSPYGLPNFLKKLNEVSGPSRTPGWLSDHPSTPDRITKTEAEAAQLEKTPRPVPISLIEEDPAHPITDTSAQVQTK